VSGEWTVANGNLKPTGCGRWGGGTGTERSGLEVAPGLQRGIEAGTEGQ
jgi:hypothetical protein